jgi:hypothetical protein
MDWSVVMTRIACVLAGVVSLAVTGSRPEVDGLQFALAFRAGAAAQYRNQQVRGSGVNFHGAIMERIADGTTRPSLVITVGAVREGAAPALIKTWDEFVAAERARTTLAVALSGADLPVPAAGTPQTYEFSGVYNGQVRTIMRVPAAADSPTPDSGPCKGEQPRGSEGSFYCAPLLVSATAELVK